MGLFDLFKGKKPETSKSIKASSIYDLLREDPAIDEHFAAAPVSASASQSEATRKKLRNNARYEVANNTTLKAIIEARTNSIIGKNISVVIPPTTSRLNRASEKIVKKITDSIANKWSEWTEDIRLGDKIRSCISARIIDGESFIAMIPTPMENGIDLFPRVFDCDRVAGDNGLDDDYWLDGIKYNRITGEAESYQFLLQNPKGDELSNTLNPYASVKKDYTELKVDHVFHAMKVQPGEHHRGASELASCLKSAAMLRRLTNAITQSAEVSANLSAVLTSEFETADEEISLPSEFQNIPSVAGQMVMLPNGVKMNAMPSVNPSSNLEDFRANLTIEIGRSLQLPQYKSLGSSAGYNFSSAQLDRMEEQGILAIEREQIESGLLCKLFSLWVAYGIEGDYFTEKEKAFLVGPEGKLPKVTFIFETDSQDVDPAKIENARGAAIANGVKTRSEVLAARGIDLDKFDETAAKEFGVSVEEYRNGLFNKHMSVNVNLNQETEQEKKADPIKKKGESNEK